jgi:hypothetical protein
VKTFVAGSWRMQENGHHPTLEAQGRVTVLALRAAVTLAAGCGPLATPSLLFLTRDRCVDTGTMRARLDEALERLAPPRKGYTVVDVETRPESEPRGGYGTPTILVDSRDLFGTPEPPVPHPPPT